MNANKTNFFKVAMFVLLIIFGVTLISVNAQDKKVKDKIKSIEGDAKIITIVTDKETYTFEADDAGVLLNYLKDAGDEKSYGIYIDDEETDGNIFVFKSDGDEKDEKNFIIKKFDKDFSLESGDDGEFTKVIIEEKNGDKKVTVITKKDGKEDVKVYEGKEADEYLEKNEPGYKMKIVECEGDESSSMVWNVLKDDVGKMVEVEIKNGDKKVTITTTEDGKEKKEIFEGDEAEEQLKKLEKEQNIDFSGDHIIYIQGDDDKCKDKDETIIIKMKDSDCKKVSKKKIIIGKEKKEDTKDKK